MRTHTFTVLLDREPTDEKHDRLYEAGLDDASVETENGTGLLHVDREAPSLDDAILSVLHDLRVAGCRATGLQQDDLVSLKTIAQRAGRSYEGIRLLATGKRGLGGFPPPLSGDGWSLYSWALVSAWFREHYQVGDEVDDYSRTIAVADLMARAQLIAHSGRRRIDVGSFAAGFASFEAETDAQNA